MKKRISCSLSVCVAIVVSAAWFAQAGPLTPPLGPVASTGRFSPRGEITSLPFTITSPGSYYLGSSLTAPGPGPGITISANNVDIDLNGFELIGAGGGAGASGIVLSGGFTNTTVHDGTVRGWNDVGVDLGFGSYAHVYNVRVFDCFGDGFRLGSWGIIRNSQASQTAVGIIIVENCEVSKCVTTNNVLEGILAGFGCQITDCVSTSNGRRGYLLTGECTLVDSSANLNAEHGIEAFTSCRIANCTASDNGVGGFVGSGILVDDGTTIDGCVADRNFEDGIAIVTRGNVTDSSANDNGGDGIDASSASVVNCQASGNTENGILAVQSLVKSSLANGNTLSGINVGDGCYVYRNNSNFNSGDGITASGLRNSIEFNHCVGNTGAAVSTSNGGADVVVSNRETGNGSGYVVDALDSVGPIYGGPGTVTTGAAGDHGVNISY